MMWLLVVGSTVSSQSNSPNGSHLPLVASDIFPSIMGCSGPSSAPGYKEIMANQASGELTSAKVLSIYYPFWSTGTITAVLNSLINLK